jgi:hypothetical protein
LFRTYTEVIYETQFADPVPGCTGGPVGLLEAAIDGAVQHPAGRPIDDGATPGGQLDAAALGHDDAPGLELLVDDSAAG